MVKACKSLIGVSRDVLARGRADGLEWVDMYESEISRLEKITSSSSSSILSPLTKSTMSPMGASSSPMQTTERAIQVGFNFEALAHDCQQAMWKLVDSLKVATSDDEYDDTLADTSNALGNMLGAISLYLKDHHDASGSGMRRSEGRVDSLIRHDCLGLALVNSPLTAIMNALGSPSCDTTCVISTSMFVDAFFHIFMTLSSSDNGRRYLTTSQGSRILFKSVITFVEAKYHDQGLDREIVTRFIWGLTLVSNLSKQFQSVAGPTVFMFGRTLCDGSADDDGTDDTALTDYRDALINFILTLVSSNGVLRSFISSIQLHTDLTDFLLALFRRIPQGTNDEQDFSYRILAIIVQSEPSIRDLIRQNEEFLKMSFPDSTIGAKLQKLCAEAAVPEVLFDSSAVANAVLESIHKGISDLDDEFASHSHVLHKYEQR
jgi:hypothetical protein